MFIWAWEPFRLKNAVCYTMFHFSASDLLGVMRHSSQAAGRHISSGRFTCLELREEGTMSFFY